jgi:hypothetical protein
VKVHFGRQAVLYPEMDDTFDGVIQRYRVAVLRWQDLTDKNAHVSLNGEKLSDERRLDEERAYDEVDSARQAVFAAAALAHPTIH